MIRIIIAGIFLVLYFLCAAPLLGIYGLIHQKDQEKCDYFSLRTVQWGFRQVLKIAGAKVTYIGLENIPENTGVLYTSNHQSMFDIVASYSVLPYLTGFISKDGVKKVPILPYLMRKVHCLFLNREDPREGVKTIKESFGLIEQGISMFIYPEGTRNKNPDPTQLLMFHNGSFKAAQRTGCPVIPVSVCGGRAILEDHFPLLRSGKMIVHFGKPVYYADLTADEKKHIGDHFADVIGSMLKEDLKLLK